MRLPNAENAIIPPSKLTDYLLSAAHPRGRGKALFFRSFGFGHMNPGLLEQALLKHVLTHDVVGTHHSTRGVKYEVEGPLPAPDGRAPMVRSVWIIVSGDVQPRFVTAIPASRRKE